MRQPPLHAVNTRHNMVYGHSFNVLMGHQKSARRVKVKRAALLNNA